MRGTCLLHQRHDVHEINQPPTLRMAQASEVEVERCQDRCIMAANEMSIPVLSSLSPSTVEKWSPRSVEKWEETVKTGCHLATFRNAKARLDVSNRCIKSKAQALPGDVGRRDRSRGLSLELRKREPEQPRYNPVSKTELRRRRFSVSVCTPP